MGSHGDGALLHAAEKYSNEFWTAGKGTGTPLAAPSEPSHLWARSWSREPTKEELDRVKEWDIR